MCFRVFFWLHQAAENKIVVLHCEALRHNTFPHGIDVHVHRKCTLNTICQPYTALSRVANDEPIDLDSEICGHFKANEQIGTFTASGKFPLPI